LTLVVGSGLKRTAEVSGAARTPGARAPEVKITDFATVVEPKERLRPVDAEYLANIDRAKALERLISRVVADVITGRTTVEETNLQLGAIRDAVLDKTLFDSVLQKYKYKTIIKEPPRAPTLDFDTATKKAAEIIREVESGKLPEHRAFVELADFRASVADKAGFDRLFGAKLREYGEQYVQWLLNSGLDVPSVALNLRGYEGVLGRQFIERYVPDYGRVLAEVESKLSQLKPVSPREAPMLKPKREELERIVGALFDDVLASRKDFFKASEELYWLWNRLSPEKRAELEMILHDLNAYYGERFGITLEPWRPSLLESILRRAELFAADVRSALVNAPKTTAELIKSKVKTVEEFLSPEHLAKQWKHMRFIMLEDKLYSIAESFSRGKIGLEDAKKALAELAGRYEKLGAEEMAGTIREKLKDDEALKRYLDAVLGLRKGSIPKSIDTLELRKGSMPKPMLWPVVLRLGKARDAVVGAVREFAPELRRYTWEGWRFAEAEGRLADLVKRFELGEVSLEKARRETSKLIKEIEKTRGRDTAEGYRKYFEEVVLRREFDDVVRKFRRAEISPEETRRRLMEIVDEIEKKIGKERADSYRKYAEELLTGRREEPARVEEKPRLPDESVFERDRKMMLETEFSRRGFEFESVVNKYRLGEISRKQAEKRLMQIVEEIEKLSDQLGDKKWTKLYNREYVKEVLSGKYGGPSRAMKERGGRGQQLLLLEKEKIVSEKTPVGLTRLSSRGATVTPLERPIRAASASDTRQRPVAETAPRQVLTPEERSALVQALRARAEAIPEHALAPEIRQALIQAQLVRQKLAEISELLKSPRAVQLLKEEPRLKKRRRLIAVPSLVRPETTTLIPPIPKSDIPKTPEGDLKYNPPLLTTTTPTPTVDVPPTPTYTPLVPQFTTYDVPTVPTYTSPTYTTTTPTYDRYPRRLPYGWWRFLPPHMFADRRTGEGAYKVQEGKKQILALA
jgi:exonuclease VII small subunit